jgi:hypothetical protein
MDALVSVRPWTQQTLSSIAEMTAHEKRRESRAPTRGRNEQSAQNRAHVGCYRWVRYLGCDSSSGGSEQVHFYNSPAAAAFLHQNLLSISCYLSVSRSWSLTHRSQRCR